VADLLHDAVGAFRGSGSSGLMRRSARYIYNGTLYDLSLDPPRVQKDARYAERVYPVLLDGSFRLRNTTTGAEESFSIVFGVDGALAEVPVCITYQPRWWFKAELVLDDRETF
jgi:hypothetical protein